MLNKNIKIEYIILRQFFELNIRSSQLKKKHDIVHVNHFKNTILKF